MITTGISWRAAFIFQAAVIVLIVLLSRRIADPLPPDPTRPFDAFGAVLSAVGMFFVVFGILQADTNPVLMAVLLAAGAAFLIWFFLYTRARERAGKEPLLPTALFKNRTSNLGLITQNIQWLLLMGVSFTVAVFLQEVRGYNAIETGVIFTAATVGVLVSSLAAERLAKRRPQKTLIIAGFVVTMAGIGLLLALVGASSRVIAFAPGLLLIGLGLGVMLTPSVNLVQSSFPEDLQAEISGLSRSVSNLGSSFGTAIAGTILVSDLASGNTSYVLAMVALAVLALIGLAAAIRLPRSATPPTTVERPRRHTRARHGGRTGLNRRARITAQGRSARGAADGAVRPRPKASMRPQRPGMSSSSSCPIAVGSAGSTMRWSPIGSSPSIVRRSSSGVPVDHACGLHAVGYCTGYLVTVRA